METAVMIDGAFLRKKFHSKFKKDITPTDVQTFTHSILQKSGLGNNSFRAYFYDCSPCTAKTSLPVTNRAFLFDSQPQYQKGLDLLSGISQLDFFAVRLGQLQFSGWSLKKKCYTQPTPYTDDCFVPNLSQKGVDIKIGLDMAWIGYQNIAKHIVLVTGDSDFIPAIKVARKSGVFVWLYTLAHNVKADLKMNADVSKSDDLRNIMQCS